MKILLIGASGQLGGDLLRNNPGHEFVTPGREALDLARSAQAANVIRRMRPEMVINCAAFHNVPECEQDLEVLDAVLHVKGNALAGLQPELGAQSRGQLRRPFCQLAIAQDRARPKCNCRCAREPARRGEKKAGNIHRRKNRRAFAVVARATSAAGVLSASDSVAST